ncbi:MAG: DAK2 domain-containing protein [candidate division WOR-3 bacterium]|nr:MAG: DAK2 domain-containing protein [candidate division WOR-3 bacterium]
MKQVETLDGRGLHAMLGCATAWLEKSASDIDALNVFPVPDGDTGTNMLLTMNAAVEQAGRTADGSASAVAHAAASGALTGARGNSGVILSQILHGLAQRLAGQDTVAGRGLAEALQHSSARAYQALSDPVEGTILTVVRDASDAAQAQASRGQSDLVSVMTAAVDAARESVANTPLLLPVLMDAGVVDAGGQGLYTILEGALQYLQGEADQMQLRRPWLVTAAVPQAHLTQAPEGKRYGYCTEFMLSGQELDSDRVKSELTSCGQSLIVAGDDSAIRVHIHTQDPDGVLRLARALGNVDRVSVRDMDAQHQGSAQKRSQTTAATGAAVIAVASGDGIQDVFRSLGAVAIVDGGETMNPSTGDLLRAVESAPAQSVAILCNNPDVVLAAEQVRPLSRKTVAVVPTETVAQGVAALLAFDYQADFETNLSLMNRARSAVKTIAVTRAARATRLGGRTIKKGQAVGFLDRSLVAVADRTDTALDQAMAGLDMAAATLVTVYYGADTDPDDARQVGARIQDRHAGLQVDVVRGGQPHYGYIVSVE